MATRGQKPKHKVKIRWSSNFAYAVGLIVSDGSLSKSGRHISFVSKDRVQIRNYLKALNIKSKVDIVPGFNKSFGYRVQFSDVAFYRFLQSIGIMNAKSKIIGEVLIPEKYFSDFIRGLFDGDGYSYSYWDKRWASSFMIYIGFVSASIKFIDWLRFSLNKHAGLKGHITTQTGRGRLCFQLKYAKTEAIKLKKYMYRGKNKLFLPRKLLKLNRSLYIVAKSEK